MLTLLATYAVLLICWSLVMRRHASRAARAGAEPDARAPGTPGEADPWAELDAAVGPAGPPRGAASEPAGPARAFSWWPASG